MTNRNTQGTDPQLGIPAIQAPVVGGGMVVMHMEPTMIRDQRGFLVQFGWPQPFQILVGPVFCMNDNATIGGVAALLRQCFEQGVVYTIEHLRKELEGAGLKDMLLEVKPIQTESKHE